MAILQNNKQDRDSYFLAAGKLLGYPECCILAYIEVDDPKNSLNPQRKIWVENGWFFPCQRHATEIENEAVSVSNLIKNRHPNLPAFSLTCSNEDLIELDKKVKIILKEQDPVKWQWLKVD